jgi:hypothetical protein
MREVEKKEKNENLKNMCVVRVYKEPPLRSIIIKCVRQSVWYSSVTVGLER